MHLLVLSAFRLDSVSMFVWIDRFVSMHLLVLSAFRLGTDLQKIFEYTGLNAPSGAQCFPTREREEKGARGSCVSMHLLVLSAFRHNGRRCLGGGIQVSMHLLVLSAFRLEGRRRRRRPR